ncbi:MAG TPA: FAD-binding protein [Gammaproteobacteria bacterium]|nr:FAD-binding protein [Gammaproteobacteria bacterium]HJN00145.1 FAD-binding protein [Gammaproteobacteria bacterium]
MTKILVIAEHFDGEILSATSKTVNCASQISESIDILVLGDDSAVASQATTIDAVSNVLSISNEAFGYPVSSIMAPVVAEISSEYDYILLPSSTFGKDLAPRISAILDVNQVTDIMSVEEPRIFKRPIYAGNAIQTIKIAEGKKVLGTVRTASFKELGNSNSANLIETEMPSVDIPSHTRFIKIESEKTERPDLQVASIVISGGRGVGSAENFELLYQLADKLGASVGASRAAVDAGFVPNDMQVGQTGKIIAPDLYFAIGISGAIQHIAGIKDAGTIVAVNKDADAPIFEIADIGIVADLFEFIPQLTSKLD